METPKSRLCPLIAFNQIVGGKYKLRILWVLSKGPKRYGEIQRSLVLACQGKSVTPRILSRELKDLVERGLIGRKAFPEVPPRVEYTLARAGATLLPVIEEIIRWGIGGHHEAIVRHSAVHAARASRAKAQSPV
jgi:DNA-binding HxlR family transcriptional regulator